MKYSHCPKCGGKLAKIFISKENPDRLQCQSCSFIFYQNPAPTACALIVNDENRILLGKRSIEPSKVLWDLAGGFVEWGEHPQECLKREVREELGVEVEIVKLLGIFMDTYSTPPDQSGISTMNLCYVARIKNGNPTPADDMGELKWFSADEFPKILAFKNVHDAL